MDAALSPASVDPRLDWARAWAAQVAADLASSADMGERLLAAAAAQVDSQGLSLARDGRGFDVPMTLRIDVPPMPEGWGATESSTQVCDVSCWDVGSFHLLCHSHCHTVTTVSD